LRGLARVESSSASPRKWVERSGLGVSGATVVFTGLGLAKFDVILSLYDRQDWQAWEAFQPSLKPPTMQNPKAISVAHPWLKTCNISACVVLDVSLPKVDEYGVATVVIACQAYRKPQISFAKPEGAKATPTDPKEAEIDANRALIAAQREALALSTEEFRRRFPNGF
jgi:hypothetical protein